jgi:alpha-ribazole phosphatase
LNTTDTLIDLVRHGQIDGPSALYGLTDVALTEQGWQQLQQATAAITPTPQRIISSPLQRCADFAHHYARYGARIGNQDEKPHKPLPLQIEADLREYHFGDWDGIPFEQLFGAPQDNPAGWTALDAFAQAPAINTPPNAETLQQMYERVQLCWQRLLQELAGQHSLIICHGGVIRMILALLLPLDWRDGRLFSLLNIGYASRTRIRIGRHTGAQPVVEFIGIPAPQAV